MLDNKGKLRTQDFTFLWRCSLHRA